jgi:hypothetical protein
MLNSLNFAESSADIFTLFVASTESDIVKEKRMHCITIKRDEIEDIVLYDSFGLFTMSSKFILVIRIEPTNTPNNNINGEKDTKMLDSTFIIESDVSILESFNTNNINTPTDNPMEEYASVFPITEFEEKDLIVMTNTVMPPAMRE